MARMGAVVEAQRLIRLHESAATPAFRQALIDLASVSELLAAELPAPSLAQEAAYPARLAVWQERRGSAWVYFCFSRKAEARSGWLDQLHTIFVHWRRSPLPLALLLPPSITLRTAAMPRS